MRDVKSKIDDFKDWVVKHKTLSIALPLVLVLSSFFVIENIKDYKSMSLDSKESKGFNSTLPSPNTKKSTQLEDEALWKQSSTVDGNQHSIPESSPELLEKAQKEDSLKKVLKELEDISFDLEQNQTVISETSPTQEKRRGITALPHWDKDLCEWEQLLDLEGYVGTCATLKWFLKRLSDDLFQDFAT